MVDIDTDGSLKYQIEISNGSCNAALDFYGYNDCFKEFAEALAMFPKTFKDETIFQVGEDGCETNWAYFLKLKVFCYNVNGDSAIEVTIDNKQEEPDRYRSYFFITTLPIRLNDLGKELLAWNSNMTREFEWIV